MEEMTSSRLVLRNLLRESKVQRSKVEEKLKPKENPDLNSAKSTVDSDKFSQIDLNTNERKEQIRVGKIILDFVSREKVDSSLVTSEVKKSVGRPRKLENDKAKNVTVCLSKELIDFLDNLSIQRGRGTKIAKIIQSYISDRKREKEHASIIEESLKKVNIELESFSKNYKRSELFSQNEKSLQSLEKNINNVRLVTNLYKYTHDELRSLLKKESFETYEFCLTWISNRSGDYSV